MQESNNFFAEVLKACFGNKIKLNEVKSCSGGCINNAVVLKTTLGNFFFKWNKNAPSDMFEAEAKGLMLLRVANKIQLPKPLSQGIYNEIPYLLLEFIEEKEKHINFWEDFGRSIAELHTSTNSYYGLDHENYIGKLHQKNTPEKNWIFFFIENRLKMQLNMAIEKKLVPLEWLPKFENLFNKLPELLPLEPPALLHGDLWSGNFMSNDKGEPVIIDPAVYYGHREIEIAFTHLFGGFSYKFYDSYNEAFPILPRFKERIEVYNLYPLLVHVNLFGAGYLSGIKTTLDKFI
jgi:protein-ribulosamine 3-kinase